MDYKIHPLLELQTRYEIFINTISLDLVFIKILEASLSASLIIVLILIARLLLKSAPKKYSYFLWSAVFLRLLLFTGFYSPVSLGVKLDIEGYNLSRKGINLASSSNAFINTVKDSFSDNSAVQQVTAKNEVIAAFNWEVFINFFKYLWLLGFIGILIFGIVRTILLNRKLKASVYFKDNIYICDYIDTAFVKGVFKPKIYLSSKVSEEEARFIIFHENFHLKRHDNVFKFIAFLLLSINWFNPFVWIFFIFFTCDMELSCDDAVLSYFGQEDKEGYIKSILDLTLKRTKNFTPALFFGECNLKSRLTSAINYKKPGKKLTVILVSVILILFILLISYNSPQVLGYKYDKDGLSRSIENFASNHFESEDSLTLMKDCDSIILKAEKDGDIYKTYALVMYIAYDYSESGLSEISRIYTPAIFEVKENVIKDYFSTYYNYEVLSYHFPENNDNLEAEVKALFPDDIENEALNFSKYQNGLETNIRNYIDTVYLNSYSTIAFDFDFKNNSIIDNLPDFEEGEIKWAQIHSSSCSIAIADCSNEYTKSYIDLLKALGYEITEERINETTKTIILEKGSTSLIICYSENSVRFTIYN